MLKGKKRQVLLYGINHMLENPALDEHLRREYNLLALARDLNLKGIAQLRKVEIGQDEVALFTDYHGVELDQWLEASRAPKQLPRICLDVLSAIELLEENGYRPGNLNCLSIYIDKEGVVTLGNFDQARSLDDCGKTCSRSTEFN